MPTTGMLSQISSVAGTSGARMKTVQPATSSAPSAISAWRGSSSEPAAQAARIRTRNIVSVSYAAIGSSSVKASGARGDRERDDERRPPPEEQRAGREERDRRDPDAVLVDVHPDVALRQDHDREREHLEGVVPGQDEGAVSHEETVLEVTGLHHRPV